MDTLTLQQLFGSPAKEFFFFWNRENSTVRPYLMVDILRGTGLGRLRLGNERYINRCDGSFAPLIDLNCSNVAPNFETFELKYDIINGLPKILVALVDGHYDAEGQSVHKTFSAYSEKIIFHFSKPLMTIVIDPMGTSFSVGGLNEAVR